MRIGLRFSCASLACVSITAMAAGQTAAKPRVEPEVQTVGAPWRPPPPTITAQSNLVELEVVVRDGKGRVVSNLTQDRFRILDQKKPRAISYFARVGPGAGAAGDRAASGAAQAPAAEAGRSIVLLFDDISTRAPDLALARNAALKFVGRQLGPDVRIGVGTTSGVVQCPLTRDAAQLAAAIRRITPRPRMDLSLAQCPRMTAYEAEMIALYKDPMALSAVRAESPYCDPGPLGGGMDYVMMLAQATWTQARGVSFEVLKAVDDVIAYLGRQKGERVLVLASSGFLSDELAKLKDDMIQRALHAGVVINALSARGLAARGPGRELGDVTETLPIATFWFEETSRLPQEQAEDDAMESLARATGRLFFHDSNDLALGFERLGLAPSMHYELGFVPVGIKPNGKLHKLKITLAPPLKGASVQARSGYYAPSPEHDASDLALRLADAMRAAATQPPRSKPRSGKPLPAQLEVSSGESQVSVKVQLDVDKLKFLNQRGRRRDQIVVIAALFDDSGACITGNFGALTLALTSARWKAMKATGARTLLDLTAPAGQYELRVAVGESSNGRLIAFRRPVILRRW